MIYNKVLFFLPVASAVVFIHIAMQCFLSELQLQLQTGHMQTGEKGPMCKKVDF